LKPRGEGRSPVIQNNNQSAAAASTPNEQRQVSRGNCATQPRAPTQISRQLMLSSFTRGKRAAPQPVCVRPSRMPSKMDRAQIGGQCRTDVVHKPAATFGVNAEQPRINLAGRHPPGNTQPVRCSVGRRPRRETRRRPVEHVSPPRIRLKKRIVGARRDFCRVTLAAASRSSCRWGGN